MASPKRIGIDLSGGDNPAVTRKAAVLAAAYNPGIQVVACGPKYDLREMSRQDALMLELASPIEIECSVHGAEIRQLVRLLADGSIDAWVTPSKSELVWAAVRGADLIEDGLLSPALVAPLPTANTAGPGNLGFVMDVGLTNDVTHPEIYAQWAALGSRFLEEQYGIAADQTRFGLYYIAEEVKRAPDWIRQIDARLRLLPGYYGLAEPRVVREGKIDLWLGPGYIGNGIIKVLGAWLTREQRNDPVFLLSPFVGTKQGKLVCRTHGSASAEMIAGAIVAAARYLPAEPENTQ
jgi:fatty acid/phospholipid biosynthesis enzyme